MSRFVLPQESTFDINGLPQVDGTLDFHNPSLLTDKDTFPTEADALAGTNANTNPVVANASGNFGNIWLVGNYDVTLKDSSGTTIWGPEEVKSFATSSTSTQLNPLTVAVMTADTRFTSADVGISVPETKENTTGNGGSGKYDIISGTGTANGFNIIAHDTELISFVLRFGGVAFVEQFGLPTDVNAAQAAMDSGAINIVFLPRTYTYDQQLNPPVGITIESYGATINWTDFGNTLAVTVQDHAETGNGCRLLNNTTWKGGLLTTTNVPTPSDRSIPAANFSGAFWNVFAIGHFNTITTSSPATTTSNIVIRDVKTLLASGDRSSGIFGAGHVHDILIENWIDDSALATSATNFNGCEFSWGSGAPGDTYAPFNLTFINTKTIGVNLSSYEGLRLSGCYDVAVSVYRSFNAQECLTLYIGDPGTNASFGNVAQDSSRIGTGITVRDVICEKFNIGIQILGEGLGSTHTDPKTNLLDVQVSDFYLVGNGKTVNTAPWTSNVGIFANTARGYTVENGTIREVFVAGVSHNSSTGGAFTTPNEIKLDTLHIYNCGRDGILYSDLTESKLLNLKIHDTNASGVTPNASINLSDTTDVDIIDCRLGKVGDTTRVSVNVSGTSSEIHLIRTDTLEEAAGVYVESTPGQLVIHGDCNDTGSTTTSAKRFSDPRNTFNIGFLRGSGTIATGVVPIAGSHSLVDTEAAAASDDLDGIDFPNARQGDTVYLVQTSSSRVINVRHGQSVGSGIQTRTSTGAAILLGQGPVRFTLSGGSWFMEK